MKKEEKLEFPLGSTKEELDKKSKEMEKKVEEGLKAWNSAYEFNPVTPKWMKVGVFVVFIFVFSAIFSGIYSIVRNSHQSSSISLVENKKE